jgi:hypothetical protein
MTPSLFLLASQPVGRCPQLLTRAEPRGAIVHAGGGDRDVTPGSQDMTQRVLCRQATKDVDGADKQDATHARHLMTRLIE